MKRTHLVIGIVGIAITLLLAGCKSKASYVRENKCTQTGYSRDQKFYSEGMIHIWEGAHIYECPDGTEVVIRNNERQP